ncbi:MAG: SusC/RagA family TonB-linked outer membrane protein [Bacteroidales bacterium]|nr:SusC/RagA family TonB-linked outer membrane protein [Bacteroidales bacterium]
MKQLSRNLFLVALLSILVSFPSYAQKKVDVTVKDQVGPVPGVNILIKGTTTGSTTDMDGNATLTVKDSDILSISCIGYADQEVKVGNQTKITVTLVEDSEIIEETVVVGYGVQKKASLTSSIANIQAEDIVSTKQNDLVASLQGKVPGLQIKQVSGQGGFFDSDLSLRGYGEPLVIIDGVARTSNRKAGVWGGGNSQSSSAALASLNPDDIESISVLKDASAAIYGVGAQNGVILVTTKKGTVGKPNISYSNILTFGVPTARPEEVDIVTYMKAENEMRINSKKAAYFSDETIQHYINGDPGYIDFNWYDEIMKKYTFNQTHNVSLRGGSNQTTYYLSANYVDSDQLYKSDAGQYKRLGFTGNVTANFSQNLSVTYQASLNYSYYLNPPQNTAMNWNYYSLLAERTIPPTAFGDDTHYTDQPQAEHRNIYALLQTKDAGYQKDYMYGIRNNIDVKYSAPWLKGLVLQASGAFDLDVAQKNDLLLSFPLYDYWTNEMVNQNPDVPQYSEAWSNRTKLYGRVQANYNTTIASDHHLGVTLASEITKNGVKSVSASRQYQGLYTHDTIGQGVVATQKNDGTRSQSANAGYIGRVNWDYKGKYLAEVMARYDGNYLYAPGYRWGLFPSYSLGWRVSEEAFFKKLFPKINNFKLRWSDGMTGRAQGSAYAWQLGYSKSGSYVFNDNSAANGYVSHSVAETLVSWADVRMMDFGFDLEAWQGKLGLTLDWFWRETSGIAAQSSVSVPDFYGLSLPQQNFNKSENVGIDGTITHRNNIGKFNYRVALTASYSRYRTTYLKSEETKKYTSANDYYMNHTEGRWANARSASTYHWVAGNPQFSSWQDICDSPVMYSLVQPTSDMLPGMYKIDDRNGDGVINDNDLYFDWSETNPPLQFGLTFSGSYGNFDFSMNWSGASLTNKSVAVSGGCGYGFFNTFYENYMDHWTLADGYTDPFDPQSQWVAGYWPAIAKAKSAYDTNSNNTYRKNQPYSFVDGTYLRLKSLEIGYRIPKSVLSKIKVGSVRVYANGTNLLTFCNKLLKPYDPERSQSSWLGVGGAPLIKNFSFGVNVSF